MDIFYKRPLSLILCILLGGFCLFSLSSGTFAVVGFLILLALSLILSKRTGGRLTSLFAVSALLLSLIAALLYPVYFRVHERFAGRVEVVAVVTDITETEYNGRSLDLKTVRIAGRRAGTHRLKMNLTESEAADFSIGSVIAFEGELLAFESTDGFDAEAYYATRGFAARAIADGDIETVGHKNLPDFGFLREAIERKAVYQSGKEAASLFCALFTGERDHLSEKLRLDFTRIGINHVLALSGMHLAILSALLEKLLRVLGLGKKPRALLLVLAVLFYMAMTGFSASVTRAGIMLIIVSVTFLCSSTRDSFTSLCVAVFLIVLAEPYAVSDLSLWLSALATLGVIAAASLGRRRQRRWCYRPEPRGKRRIRIILTSAAITVFAISATLAITALTFPGISTLSIITTPIFSFLAEVYIYAGLAALAIGQLLPIGRLLPPIYAITSGIADLFSDWKWAYFSTDFTAVKVLVIISSMVFFSFIVFKFKQKILCALAILSMLIATLTTAGVLTTAEHWRDRLLYYSSDGCECILMQSCGELAILDLSSGRAPSRYTVLAAIKQLNAMEVDHLVFAYYTTNLPEKAADTATVALTHRVYLPRPKNDAEREIADEVTRALADSHAEICYYTEDIGLTLGDFTLTRLYSSEYGDGAPRGAAAIERNGESLIYLSSGILEDSAGATVAQEAISSCSHLILGSGGKSYKKSYTFASKLAGIKTLILSGKRLRFSQEAFAFYEENGTSFLLHPESAEILP